MSFLQKNNAKKLIEEQGLLLSDKIQLLRNESTSGIGDYYHTFTILVSDEDKKRMIIQIKEASDFKNIETPISDILSEISTENHNAGYKKIQNYETDSCFVREYSESKGKGHSPIYRKISVYKRNNSVVFEDIDL